MAFVLQLLGGFHLVGADGKPVALPDRARALLAYLAVASSPVPRHSLAELLSAEGDEQEQRTALRQAVYVARKAMADSAVICTQEDDLALNDALVKADVRQFQGAIARGDDRSLAEAVELYRGPFLDAEKSPSSAFEEWLGARRADFLEHTLEALLKLAGCEAAAGRHDSALGHARRALTLDPLREDGHRQVMRSLAAMGQRSNALRQYETLRQTLADELGVAPEADTEALREAIARGAEPDSNSRTAAVPPARRNMGEPVPVNRAAVEAAPGRPARRWLGATRQIAAVLVLAVAAGVIWSVTRLPDRCATPVTPECAVGIPAVVVLPFQNLTGDPTLDPVGPGIAEDLRDLLWNFPDFQVVSSTSSDASPRFVIEGSVRRISDKALITAQLIEGGTDTQLWSDRFEESIDDPGALERAVAKRLFQTFGGFTGVMRSAYERIAWSKAEADLTEYDYYVRGHTHSFHFTKDEFDRGRQIWEAGLKRYPDSVLLRIKVSFAHASDILNYWSKDPGADAVQLRRFVAEAAQLLSERRRSRFEEWFLHWGSHYRYWSERDFGRCTAEAKATLTYAPYEAFTLQDVAWGYAACGGNAEEAIAWVKEAIRLDPEGPAAGPQFYLYTLAFVSYFAGRYQEVADLIEKEKLDMPLILIASYVQLGRLDEARSNMAAFVKGNPDRTLKDEADFPFALFDPLQQRWLDDLRAAGLPEK